MQEECAIKVIGTWRCELNVKTRAFLKKIPFRTSSRFQNRVSCNLRKGASKSARFLTKVQISERSVWEKWNRTSAFWPSVLRKSVLLVASAAPAPLFLPQRPCARPPPLNVIIFQRTILPDSLSERSRCRSQIDPNSWTLHLRTTFCRRKNIQVRLLWTVSAKESCKFVRKTVRPADGTHNLFSAKVCW